MKVHGSVTRKSVKISMKKYQKIKKVSYWKEQINYSIIEMHAKKCGIRQEINSWEYLILNHEQLFPTKANCDSFTFQSGNDHITLFSLLMIMLPFNL
jgi:hypothetical protein